MEREGLDALIVCGNQYAGFEGAVFYTSGFEIVHRYVYVLLPHAGEPTLVFPREARWIGDKAKPWVKDQVWPDIPGQWIRERGRECGWKRVGVYGMNFIMAVRDYRELCHGQFELIPFDFQFDMARAVKSQEELAEVRDAMDIILDGFWALVAAYEPGKTEAEIMAPAVERFFARGAGPRMMNFEMCLGFAVRAAKDNVHHPRACTPREKTLHGRSHDFSFGLSGTISAQKRIEAIEDDVHRVAHARQFFFAFHRARQVELKIKRHKIEGAMLQFPVVAHGHNEVQSIDGDAFPFFLFHLLAQPFPRNFRPHLIPHPRRFLVANPACFAR